MGSNDYYRFANIVSGKGDVQINNSNNMNQQHSADQRRPRQGKNNAWCQQVYKSLRKSMFS